MTFCISRVLVGLCLVASRSLACSCSSGAAGCQIPSADAIFLANVVSKSETEAGGTTLRVIERFRGDAEVSVVLPPDMTNCAYPFEVGHQYLVFAERSRGMLRVTICTATRPSRMSVATIQRLRAIRDKTALPDLYGFVGTFPGDSTFARWEKIEPVPDVTVTAHGERDEYLTKTSSDGLYAFPNLPGGPYRITIEAPARQVALWGGGAIPASGLNTGVRSGCPLNFDIVVQR